VFNKRTLCVEESVHVLFDESNPLSENDVQDEDFELGLTKKDCLSNHKQGKNPKEGSGTGPDSNTDQLASGQTGGTSAEPCLQQRSTENPELDARLRTETGPVTVSEPGSPHNQAEERPVLRTWKHQKSHPLDQILADLNSGVQTRSRMKNFCAFHAFISLMEPKNVHEAVTDLTGLWLCRMSFISLREIGYGTWSQNQKIEPSLVPSGCSETSWMSKEQSPETMHDWLFKGTIRKKALIMNRPLHQLQELRP